MLYLLIIFFVMSSLASAVVLAALMRSAQLTQQLEQNDMQSLEQSTQPFHSNASTIKHVRWKAKSQKQTANHLRLPYHGQIF